MAHDLAGKVVIVTGGASGIGLAVCRVLAQAGAYVSVADIDGPGAARAAGELTAAGLRAEAFPTDMGDARQIDALASATATAFGGIDFVVNNAVQMDQGDAAVHEIDADLWRTLLSANLIGPALLSRAAIPHMLSRGGGAFVHMASLAGMRGEDSRTCYATAKAGLFGLSRSIAVQYGKQGIRSNCIAPGLVMTPAAHAAFDPSLLNLLLEHHMTAQLGTAEQLAAAVCFLLSGQAAFMTGQVLVIDGGMSAAMPGVPAFRELKAQALAE